MNQDQLVHIIGQQTCEILFLRQQIAALKAESNPVPENTLPQE